MTFGQTSGADDLVFRLQTERDRRTLTVRVEGRLDRWSGHYLVDSLEQLTNPGDDVTIDISGLSDMDRQGADALATSMRNIQAMGSHASIATPDERFRRLLAPHGLDSSADLSVSGQAQGLADRRRP